MLFEEIRIQHHDKWSDTQWKAITDEEAKQYLSTISNDEVLDFSISAWTKQRDDLSDIAHDLHAENYVDTRPTVEFDETQIFYRGTQTDGHGATKRDGYATFVSSNPYQAATYAGPDGVITKMTLHPKKALHYDYGRHFRPTEYDDKSRKLNPGECLVALDVVDNGYFIKQVGKKSSFGSTHVSFTDDSIAKIVGKEKAAKYMEGEE